MCGSWLRFKGQPKGIICFAGWFGPGRCGRRHSQQSSVGFQFAIQRYRFIGRQSIPSRFSVGTDFSRYNNWRSRTGDGDAAALTDVGVEYVEATVAGSSDQMRDGVATLFLGGNSQIVDQLQPIFEMLTDKSFRLGTIGSASRMKLVHNLVFGLHRAVLAEGLTFAKGLGIDPSDALQILRQTPAASEVMETKGERMVSGDFAPQARLLST